MFPPSVGQIIRHMHRLGHRVFMGARGYDLNIVGIRTPDTAANTFNDWLTLFYLQGKSWVYCAFPATTDPGIYWREHPMNINGTAILKPGQYRGAYEIGTHKGRPALVQKREVTVYRDSDRDALLDVTGAPEQTGFFGINIHQASSHTTSTIVGKWSAGCQVVADHRHHDHLMRMARASARIYGPAFTYTLLASHELD